MKILILSNKTPVSKWQPVLDEARPFLKRLNEEKSIEIIETNINVPREFYGNGWGANRGWLKKVAEQYKLIYKNTIFCWYDPNFEIDGAWGWFNTNISTKDLKIIQVYRPINTKEVARFKEFNLLVARILVHEVLHAKAFKLGIADRTHEFQDKDNLSGFIDLIAKKPDPRIPLLQTIVGLYQELYRLLKSKDEVYGDDLASALRVVHHSATPRDRTTKTTVLNHFANKGDFNWYHHVIMPDGEVIDNPNRTMPHERGTVDICVMGNFEKEEPTALQIVKLKNLLFGKEYITHHELGEQGKATKSSCPARLMNYL